MTITADEIRNAYRIMSKRTDAQREAAYHRMVERLATIDKTPEDLLAVMEGVAFVVEQEPEEA